MKIYLSSTLNDLGPERQAVKDALGGECVVVESYVADENSVRESCLADVEGCDAYIGIVGGRYGYIPPGERRSITELECERARQNNKPTLIFIKDEDEIKLRMSDAGTREHPPERIESFRKQLMSGGADASRGALFKGAEDLKSHVLKAYFKLARRQSKTTDFAKEHVVKRIEGPPYRGLLPFLPEHADRFFGRDTEIEALLERLLGRNQRFLALIGASGSGKSSLVFAGLIPKLTSSPGAAGARWLAVTFSPRELGDDPFLPLAAKLHTEFPDKEWRVPTLARRLRKEPAEIDIVVNEALGEDAASVQVLLFVDQFEEVFAAAVDSGTRAAFFQTLAAAAACPLVRVVIAMRSDFYDRWPQDEASVAMLRSGHFPIALPGQAALEKMIVGPARAAGLTFKPSRLVQRILDDTGTGPGALALAEFALAKLYDRRSSGNVLTQASYEEFGGVAGAIDGLAEEAVNNAGEGLDEEAFSRLFVAVASVEEKGQELVVVRRRAARSELPEAALNLAQHLVDERLLVSTGDTIDQPAVYEVGHEAVFTHWKRFKSWLETYAEDLALRRQAERAAADWQKAHRSRSTRWIWERQKPALEALRKLNSLSPPLTDADVIDPSITTWRMLEAKLSEFDPPLRSFLRPEPLELLDELNADDTPHQRREEIGLRLNQIGDRRRGVGVDEAGLPDIGWIDIPAGEVTLETTPRHWFRIKPFRLAKYPVTWAQYRAFLAADDGYADKSWWIGRQREKELGALAASFGNYPAINISWYDALAYCRWLSAKFNFHVRLPTEWEWQWAAAGPQQNEYPWSGQWNPARANTEKAGIGRTVAVGLYPLGCSPFGIEDMSGNVWQWCLNSYADPSDVSLEKYDPVRRGGSWDLDPGSCRAANRDLLGGYSSDRYNLGFRICCGPPIPKTLDSDEHGILGSVAAQPAEPITKTDRDKTRVFLSYAMSDDQGLPSEGGWVTNFHYTLKAMLDVRLGQSVEVWRDTQIRLDRDFSASTADALSRAAVLICIVSPAYINSKWCMKEVRAFCDLAERRGDLQVNNRLRVFKVIKIPVDAEEALPEALKDTLGYPFFSVSDGTPMELDPAYGPEYAQRYKQQIAKLAWDITQLLKT
jgi:hypothetical protein